MDKTATAILEQALALPTETRAELADSLIASLDEGPDGEHEELWKAEISRRIAELDSGAVQTIAWPEARKRLYARLQDTVDSGR